MRKIAIAFAALLSGCAAPGGPFEENVGFVQIFSGYSRAGFSAFAASGPLVEMHGPLPGGADTETIAAALRLPPRFPQTPFRAIAPGSAPRSQRIVLVFGVRGGINADQVCAGDIAAGGVTDRLAVAAAWCAGSRSGSTAALQHQRALTPDDPAFTGAMRRLFGSLAPSRDENERFRSERCIPPGC